MDHSCRFRRRLKGPLRVRRRKLLNLLLRFILRSPAIILVELIHEDRSVFTGCYRTDNQENHSTDPPASDDDGYGMWNTARLQQKALLNVNVQKEIVEKDSHGINNAPGTVNISGVYQWVNKLYVHLG